MAEKRGDYLDFEKEDAELIETIESYERGEWKPVPNQAKVKKQLQQAAARHLAKNARINIRLSEFDLTQLKSKAAVEGIPYQTLIASILHKYVNGTLAPKNR